MHSLFCMGIVSVVWILWGYTLAFGADVGGLIGDLSYLGLKDVSPTEPAAFTGTIPHQTFMAFQMMFAVITPALITGAFAERMKFSAFVVFIVAWVTLVYAPLAHWVWGGGWLGAGKLGALDFAGGTVVHINSGIAALAAALIIGKRLRHGAEPMEPHNVPFVVLGAGLLWFGWFGFNAGSALSAGGTATLAFVATNTAAATAAMTWTGLSYLFTGKFSVVGAASGAVAGLVAVTPASGFVGPIPAILIGLGAGAVCYLAVRVRSKLGFDDALDVWAVHGMGGTWGAIATGLFAGMGTMGAFALADGVSRTDQIVKQLIAIGVTWGFSFIATYVILFVISKTIGLRVTETHEEQGLDLSLHGEEAYRI
jgi:Amt family ammonium transporter